MWVMSMLRLAKPTRYEFYIGSVCVARIGFTAWCELDIPGDDAVTRHRTMSEALTEMHRRLNSPAPDGATVRRKRGSPPDGESVTTSEGEGG